MLKQITGQQILIATFVLLLLWYAGVILIYYRKELNALLNGKSSKSRRSDDPLPHHWEDDLDDYTLEANYPQDDLMGKSKLPDGVLTVSSQEFGFAPDQDSKNDQLGLVPDVLEEIKDVFAVLAREDGNKRDFFDLMKVVKDSYPRISSNPNIGRINQFITEHASFHISKEELETIWL